MLLETVKYCNVLGIMLGFGFLVFDMKLFHKPVIFTKEQAFYLSIGYLKINHYNLLYEFIERKHEHW